MKVLPKPEGYDLREKRADRANSNVEWLPEDALYKASETMNESPPVNAMVVCWYSRLPNGNLTVKYWISHEHERQQIALLTDVLHNLCEAN